MRASPASELDADQQALLLDVVHEWVGILNDEAAAAKMAEIKANLPKAYFAWSGATTNGGLLGDFTDSLRPWQNQRGRDLARASQEKRHLRFCRSKQQERG